MTDQPTELTLLHDAMVECGIWDTVMIQTTDPISGHHILYRGEYGETSLPDTHALHIMRGIAEEWLGIGKPRSTENPWAPYWSLAYGTYCYHQWFMPGDPSNYQTDSLPAALRYAHEQKETTND